MKENTHKNILLEQKSLPNFSKIKERHMYQAIKLLVEENKVLIKSLEKKKNYHGPTSFRKSKSPMTKFQKHGLQ